MMYNPQLDTFLCVVEEGSFSKAAEQLYNRLRRSSNRSIRLRQVLV